MNYLQNALKIGQGGWYQFTQVRYCKWNRPKWKHPKKKVQTYEWIQPPYFKRYPPPPGVPPKVYPLEAAPQEYKERGCYPQDRWTDWKMKKDYLRRMCVKKLGRERMMLDTIHQNTILPFEIRDAAQREVQENYPRDSDVSRTVRRCAVTSRARACVEPWRISRFIFRHLADYNKLAGVRRGLW